MAEAALEAVEAAINEVTKRRKLVTARKSKQVYATDEIASLKAVAFAWLQNHQPIVAAHRAKPDLTTVNDIYSEILDATAGYAARTTYRKALQRAKAELIIIRSQIVKAPPALAATPDSPPNFAPLATNPIMQAILQRRWHEVQQCMGCDANLAATVMMGGLLESLLLARMNGSPNIGAVFTAKAAPKDRKTKQPLAFGDWKLAHMIEVAHELKWVTKSAKDIGNVLRDFRNYIHPHKEFTDKITIGTDDAKMFWEVAKLITRQVLASVGKSP